MCDAEIIDRIKGLRFTAIGKGWLTKIEFILLEVNVVSNKKSYTKTKLDSSLDGIRHLNVSGKVFYFYHY